ncbi:Major Facilitator Superfamily protein [bacterium A37T11]|nr:Major Facilitator Superfamily protein [bacterium A37T11]
MALAIEQNNKTTLFSVLSVPVIVAALGYFVDVYDMLLFGIVRIPSLKALGLSDIEISKEGASILNWQMTGLLFGGFLWGTLGDKKGRLSVLFGSIITYSIANIACGFVHEPYTYKIWRFIAGLGLAGELGAGITLVSESLPKKLRPFGTSLVGGIGMLGAVAAYFTAELFEWRVAYFVGGGMGIALLILRLGVRESTIFQQLKKNSKVQKGNFLSLVNDRGRLKRYLKCIGIGIPFWYIISVLATFSNEFGKAFHVVEPVVPGLAIMWAYVAISISDIFSGILSYKLKSRKKAVLYLILFAFVNSFIFLFHGSNSASQMYFLIFLMGIGIGYWALFVTIAAEQFGTNLRSTAATTVPNMVRGTVVLMTTAYISLKDSTGVVNAGIILGAICFTLGIYSILTISETHDKDMDFLEEIPT